MKKILLISLIIISSCSSKLTIPPKENTQPATYKRMLLVTDAYFTNQNLTQKLFNTELKNYRTISKVNTKIIHLVKKHLNNQEKYAAFYLIENDLDKNIVLTNKEIQQNIDEEVLDKNIDLVVCIFQKNVKRFYTNPIKDGGLYSNSDSHTIDYGATTDSNDLQYTYVFTAKDIRRDSVVLKSEHLVKNADNLFTNLPKRVAEKLITELQENHLY